MSQRSVPKAQIQQGPVISKTLDQPLRQQVRTSAAGSGALMLVLNSSSILVAYGLSGMIHSVVSHGRHVSDFIEINIHKQGGNARIRLTPLLINGSHNQI